MNKHFYTKLAASNLRKNSRTYLPYILSSIFTVAMFYIMFMISETTFFGHESLGQMLMLGDIIIAVFAVIFLFYTHSFLIKRRKMEFGLYNVLGMNKRHIAKVISLETLYTSLISLIIGLGFGILLSRLMYLILESLINYKLQDTVALSPESIAATLMLFVIIFALTLFNSLRLIHLSKPIELLKGGQKGEREPKVKVALTVIGILALAGGYCIAIMIEEPLDALLFFFVAVILVIIGTYCLFTSVSIFVLKMLRKNKAYYYKTSHFISVSGMIYRMKQNAVGLANICILSTIVLVTISTTVCLYSGANDIADKRFPTDISVSTGYSQEGEEAIDDAIQKTVEESEHDISNEEKLRYYSHVADGKKDSFDYAMYGSGDVVYPQHLIAVIPVSDFNMITNEKISLKDGESIVLTNRDPFKKDTITVEDMTFAVKQYKYSDEDTVEKIMSNFMGGETMSTILIVVDNMDTVKKFDIKTSYDDEEYNPVRLQYGFDIDTSPKEEIHFTDELVPALKDAASEDVSIESRAANIQDFYNTFGGLLFLGMYLGLLFLMATVLIIYYKQLSEGYEDQERFRIMQNVGLTRKEVRKAIRSQVLTMFFLPLLVACIHISFAFPMISKMLLLFGMNNTSLFMICTLACAAVFAAFYTLIYSLTSRMYYRIVEGN